MIRLKLEAKVVKLLRSDALVTTTAYYIVHSFHRGTGDSIYDLLELLGGEDTKESIFSQTFFIYGFT